LLRDSGLARVPDDWSRNAETEKEEPQKTGQGLLPPLFVLTVPSPNEVVLIDLPRRR
jgi:hypothetical protein